MAEQFLIGDGYTINGKIDKSPGIHPELRLSYRPALAAERNSFLKQVSELPEKRAKFQAELIVKHVTTWSATDRKGEPVKPSAQVLEQFQPTLLDQIVNVILGYAPSGEEEADAKNS